ncbi:DUF882 domain-containing protein [bacterium]|nr:DUF882 domain-containing protein [bacterium]
MTILNRQITPNISLYELLYTPTVNKAEIAPLIEQAWSIEVDRNLTKLATVLQIVRDYYNKPLIITSGFRPVTWELKRNRNGKSQHTSGLAADFRVSGVPLSEVYAFVNATFKKGGRAINPKANFIHLDLRPEYATWSY